MLVPVWVDAYGIDGWRIFKSSSRKMTWVGFASITTEFRLDALAD